MEGGDFGTPELMLKSTCCILETNDSAFEVPKLLTRKGYRVGNSFCHVALNGHVRKDRTRYNIVNIPHFCM